MDTGSLMVYGGGNTEIAAALEKEMEKLYGIEAVEGKIYAKHYLLNNSCLTTYKRFGQIKDTLQTVKSGGVYEYSNKGPEQCIKTQELKMTSYATKEAFEAFLEKGIDEIGGKQITLVIIGQSYDEGLLLDLYGNQPIQIGYKTFSKILEEVGKRRRVGFHLILDIPIWHAVTLPYQLVQINAVLSLFIWEREKPLDLFPLAQWLIVANEKKTNRLLLLHHHYKGYSIIPNKKRWCECKALWEAYLEKPKQDTLEHFLKVYNILVKSNDLKIKAYQNHFERPYRAIFKDKHTINYKQLQDYFKVIYNETISIDSLMRWFTELKKCINYYKM